MDFNTFSGFLTGALLVMFIGIWIWAWSPRNRARFDEAARLPFERHGEEERS